MTQGQLADRVGLRFQQIHKYETGQSSIKVSTALKIADALGVSLNYLIEEVSTVRQPADSDNLVDFPLGEDVLDRQTTSLVTAYRRLPHESRALVLSLVDTMTEQAASEADAPAQQIPVSLEN